MFGKHPNCIMVLVVPRRSFSIDETGRDYDAGARELMLVGCNANSGNLAVTASSETHNSRLFAIEPGLEDRISRT